MTNNIAGISEAFLSLEEQSFLFFEKISNINIDSFGWFVFSPISSHMVRKWESFLFLFPFLKVGDA
jgi:hypothetical protein